MGRILGDPYLTDNAVAGVAANKIKQAFFKFNEKERGKVATYPPITTSRPAFTAPTEAINSPLPDDRANFNIRAANYYYGEVYKEQLAAHFESRKGCNSMMRAAQSYHIRNLSSQIKNDEKDQQDPKIDIAKGSVDNTVYDHKDQTEFIKRMGDMAKDMVGSFYFNSESEKAILSAGVLYSKETRQDIKGGKVANNTPPVDDALMIHGHTFFFLEHKHQDFRPNRFANPIRTPSEAKPANDVPHDQRRITIPLKELMRDGTWAMKEDMLDKKAKIGQIIDNEDNIIAVSSPFGSASATREFMEQLAKAALNSTNFQGDELSAILAKTKDNDVELSRLVLSRALRPQLMVPSAVSLSTPGATLDKPAILKVQEPAARSR